jgi:leucyl aminopeptidase
MTVTFSFSKSPKKDQGDAVVFLTDKKKTLSPAAKALDKVSGGLLSDALKRSDAFSGKEQETLPVSLPSKTNFSHAVFLGLGERKDKTPLFAETCGAKLYTALHGLKVRDVNIHIENAPSENGSFAGHLAHGIGLKSYKFDKYKEVQKDDKAPKPLKCAVILEDASQAKKIYEDLYNIEQGVILARDLVNEAPNVLYPESYAALIKKELAPLGVKVEIFDEKKLDKMGMGAILAVGMGSIRPPCMVVMRWDGAGKKDDKPLGFVGKGVTFDTGGISIKPGANMDEMKMDMGGSASVVGLMKALALQKVKKNVVGIVGLAENMPSDRAYRPGDIIKSYKGKHIEVLNTDAEGRLVLVDCLTYMQEKFDPVSIVDLATLTGAMMVALAYEYTGAFVNDDKMWAALDEAGKETGEKLWRMPLDEAYRKDVESDIAAVRNLAKTGRWGGACTAAAFLEHFIDEGRKWCHLDIAGTAFSNKDLPLGPKGATGVGVRLLEKFVNG